jgi:hypothetical protein
MLEPNKDAYPSRCRLASDVNPLAHHNAGRNIDDTANGENNNAIRLGNSITK